MLPGPGIVSFSADAVDLPTETPANVARVLVAFRDETSTWRFLDLRRGPGANWGGTASVSGTQIEYFMQAVDAIGNVAVSTKRLSCSQAPRRRRRAGRASRPTLNGTKAAGWFIPSAQLKVADPAEGVVASVSIDRGPLTPFTGPVPLTGDGLHTIDVRGSNGDQVIHAPIHSQPPTVALDQPGQLASNGSVPLAFRCGDASSGVATCTATISSPTMPATPWAE